MAHYPNPQAARTVEMWTRAGIGPERIARRLGITIRDLEKNYPFELGFTDEESLAVVADVAYQMATSGSHPTMTKFWLETRGGWQSGFQAHLGSQAKPLQIIVDPAAAIDAEFEEVEESNVVEIDA